METVIERIDKGQFWPFFGGIHPPEMKFLTTDKPILQLPLPKELTIPVQQHIGEPGEILVKEGDLVEKGQVLTKATLPLSVPVHAPTSGIIKSIENSTIAHPSGLQELCIKLVPDGADKWIKRNICSEYLTLPKSTLIEKISNAGISGMGGAGFPTHIKISTNQQINYLIINAAECEPYITADDLLMRENSAAILDGINILDKILEPAFILIGIEDNKPEAIQALEKATLGIDKIKICVLPTKYPTGGEKQLIKALTGKEVPAGVLPSSLGIVMQNIATCFAIADAVIHDTPLIKRVVTVSGQALAKPQNVWALLGTPVEFLLDECGYPNQEKKHIIMGGPMMGFSLPSTQVPIVKTTNCILAPSEQEIPDNNQEVECIRCGQCAEVCPSQLLPQELQWSAKAKDHEQLNALNLFDCIECGACAYVCPSHIPLVHYYRISKAEIRQQKVLDSKAEKAKIRFEARKQRLERDKLAREEKNRKAAEARKARMNAGTKEGNNEKSAVAAALARVKAKKAQANNETNNIDNSEKIEQKSQVAAAIARAKAKKVAAAKKQESTADTPKASSNITEERDAVSTTTLVDEKTKRDENAPENMPESNDAIKVESSTPKDDKKAKIAAAIAKAKAKAKKQQTSTVEPENTAELEQESEKTLTTEDKKKARIAAAVAKAKAKKMQAEKVSETSVASVQDPVSEIADKASNKQEPSKPVDKKARIAAAVAKAKAKKQQKESQ